MTQKTVEHDLNSISKRLKFVIKQSGVKQSHIAKKLGVTRGAVHYILNNDAKNPRSVRKVAEIIGVDPEWLYTGKTKNTEQNVQSMQSPKTALRSAGVPFYYIDQLLLKKQNPDTALEPIGEIWPQRQYSENLFAIQFTNQSPLQKFEPGDIILFIETQTIKPGNWVLIHRKQEESIILGVVVLSEKDHLVVIHNKPDNPLVLRPGFDDIMGVFVESVKYAKI